MTKINFIDILNPFSVSKKPTKVIEPDNSIFYDLLFKMVMLRFRVIKEPTKAIDIFDEQYYYGVEQGIMENLDIIEGKQGQIFNWDMLDELMQQFRNKLATKFSEPKYLPFINFTINLFENYHIYEQYPDSKNNPFQEIKKWIDKGHLFLITDRKEIVEKYHPNLSNQMQESWFGGLVCLVVGKDEKIGGLVIDKRVALLYHIFKRNSYDIEYFFSPKVAKEIRETWEAKAQKQLENRQALSIKTTTSVFIEDVPVYHRKYSNKKKQTLKAKQHSSLQYTKSNKSRG